MTVTAELVREVQNCGRSTLPVLTANAGPSIGLSCQSFRPEDIHLLI